MIAFRVAVRVDLRSVAIERAVVARVAEPVCIEVALCRVGVDGAVVAGITHSIRVKVGLVRVRDQGAIVRRGARGDEERGEHLLEHDLDGIDVDDECDVVNPLDVRAAQIVSGRQIVVPREREFRWVAHLGPVAPDDLEIDGIRSYALVAVRLANPPIPDPRHTGHDRHVETQT